ncbi:hypothetical protein F4801DRAFT_591151 [Xylaria longipes]|nr:hypothetical protein F4801DRAFT_591151 [Xylaria longipes]
MGGKLGLCDSKLASSIKSNVPHYDLPSISLSYPDLVYQLHDEWYQALGRGLGCPFYCIELHQRLGSPEPELATSLTPLSTGEVASAKADHFATSGPNPHLQSFMPYYLNLWLAKVSETWLGPAYQLTAQVNLACAQVPWSIHIACQFLMLHSAVAHSNMPPASGPTRVLPFSQLLPKGYMAWREPTIRAFFYGNRVSAPTKAGDPVFFNPALLYAAGENTTTDTCWDKLKTLAADGESDQTEACVNALAGGYPFPSNLDKQQPGPDGTTPPSEADILWEGLQKGWNTYQFITAIAQLRDDSTY